MLPSHHNLRLLSVIIPARDEEGCIASTVEHLHLELDLRGVPHEIVVVDDGSTDRTWQILQQEATRLNAPSPQVSGFKSPPSTTPENTRHSSHRLVPPYQREGGSFAKADPLLLRLCHSLSR